MPLPARSLMLFLATALAAIALARAACPFAALARDGAGESHSRKLAQTGFNPQVGSLRLAEAQLCGRTAANASGRLLHRRPGSPRFPATNPPSFKSSHRHFLPMPQLFQPVNGPVDPVLPGQNVSCLSGSWADGWPSVLAAGPLAVRTDRPRILHCPDRRRRCPPTLQTNPRCIGGTIEALGAPLACCCSYAAAPQWHGLHPHDCMARGWWMHSTTCATSSGNLFMRCGTKRFRAH